MVSDRGDRGLFTIWTCSFWIKIIFPFPVSPAKWISDYFDIKGCGANNLARAHRSSLRQWRCGQNSQRKLWTRFELADFFLVRAASLFSLRAFGALAHYKDEGLVWSASLFVKQIAFSFCWRERKRKYVSQWQMACSKPIGGPNSSVRLAYFHANCLLTGLYKRETEIRWRKGDDKIKSNQTSITTVRNHPRTVASLLTPLIFHYSLPLKLLTVFKLSTPLGILFQSSSLWLEKKLRCTSSLAAFCCRFSGQSAILVALPSSVANWNQVLAWTLSIPFTIMKVWTMSSWCLLSSRVGMPGSKSFSS